MFTKSRKSGCGGDLNLTSSHTWKTQAGAKYDPFEDCLWTVSAPPGKNIEMTITSMDLQNTPNKTALHGGSCNGDFLEVLSKLKCLTNLK